jgi:rfaE bifunctional protein kinase chain/domain
MSEPKIQGVDAARLLELLQGFRGKKVLLFGDLIADVFIYGEISRISREAPILILDHKQTRVVPGGCANSVNNLSALGGAALPVGVLGADEHGRSLIDIFDEKGVPTDGILSVEGHDTTSKTRVSAGSRHVKQQQVVRVDREEPFSYDEIQRARVREILDSRVGQVDAVMISDYGQGAVDRELAAHLIKTARAAGLPVTLDSRWGLLSYPGVSAATPNEPELEEIFGEKAEGDVDRVARMGGDLRSKLDAEAVLVTRGGEGMVLVDGDGFRRILAHDDGEVADVTGAGDTVISTFTLALASGGSYYEAALLSNLAGGLVVKKWGTATVSPDELEGAVRFEAGL